MYILRYYILLNTMLAKLAYWSLSKSAVSRGKSIYHLPASLKYIIAEEELNRVFTCSVLPGVRLAEVIYIGLYRKQNPSKNQPQCFCLLYLYRNRAMNFIFLIDLGNTMYPENTTFSRIPLMNLKNFFQVYIIKF